MTVRTRVPLGASGLSVVPLGIGTWQWADPGYWGPGETEPVAVFDAAVQQGLELFDTAELYGGGRAEELLGSCLRRTDARVVVATKAFHYRRRATAGSVSRALASSLRRLGRVDLLQVHWPWPLLRERTLMRVLADAVHDGRVRAVGVSNYGVRLLRAAHRHLAAAGVPLASNQVHYSLLHRRPEANGVADTCRELDVALLAYSPLEQGLLSGRFGPDRPPPAARARSPLFAPEALAAARPVLDTLAEVAGRHACSPARVALRWLVDQPGTVPIVGARTPQHVLDAAGALDLVLDASERAALDAATRHAVRRGGLDWLR